MKFDYNLILTVISGLIICIPLVVKLVKVTKESIQNKNWYLIVKAVSELMQTAEGLMKVGSEKKQYVLTMLEVVAKQIDYQLTEAEWKKISDMIDDLVEMSKVVNALDYEE